MYASATMLTVADLRSLDDRTVNEIVIGPTRRPANERAAVTLHELNDNTYFMVYTDSLDGCPVFMGMPFQTWNAWRAWISGQR